MRLHLLPIPDFSIHCCSCPSHRVAVLPRPSSPSAPHLLNRPAARSPPRHRCVHGPLTPCPASSPSRLPPSQFNPRSQVLRGQQPARTSSLLLPDRTVHPSPRSDAVRCPLRAIANNTRSPCQSRYLTTHFHWRCGSFGHTRTSFRQTYLLYTPNTIIIPRGNPGLIR